MPKITYTYTDEAPALATHALLPVIDAFTDAAGVDVEVKDISLANRILAAFNDKLPDDQRVPDALGELGEMVKDPEANVIKLPNISASIPQLKAAIGELQSDGYPLPDYPDDPTTDDERDARKRYDSVKGSAVNPVLREGNSDRRAPESVKEYARKNPHSMGDWPKDSKTHVATMDDGNFRTTERSATVQEATTARIEHVGSDGTTTVLKDDLKISAGEIIDAAVMRRRALQEFLQQQVTDARAKDVLFSLHLKATMMKVADPIIFGHAVRIYYDELFSKHGDVLDRIGANPNNGMAAIESALDELPQDEQAPIRETIKAAYERGPDLAQVDSRRGLTNLHVPSDVIIDASMPAMIRTSGQMWNADDETQDTKAVIPDSSYADLYEETIQFCKDNGAFDPRTMGTVPNVGLMAQKAEEYGSHDKTFEIESQGTVRVVDGNGTTLLEHDVDTGDIWRMCQTTDAAIRNWIELAVNRARATGWPAVFWLDETRPHDAEVLTKVRDDLGTLDTDGLTLEIKDVAEATRYTLQRTKNGENTISVTGNVLRDYLTDLFPILEVGTSAKMLSIVPLMNGGGMFETGAGGSAPKHVQQFVKENHLRWDSLGEYLALAASLEHFAEKYDDLPRAQILATTLDRATGRYLQNGKSPSRKVNEPDNRASTFYVALYWADELAKQSQDKELAERFAPLAQTLAENEDTILDELNAVQGEPVEMGGYYSPTQDLVAAAMRPSSTLNKALEDFRA